MNHHETMIGVLKMHFGDKEITGIEIGTGGGSLPSSMLTLCENVKNLITIDPYTHRDNVEYEASWPQERLDETKDMARKRLSVYEKRVLMLHMGSDEAFEIIEDNVDFVWIDGDHIGEQVERDLRFEKFVKPGGLIGGHDFGQVPPLTEIIKAKYGDRIHTGCDFTWWVFV